MGILDGAMRGVGRAVGRAAEMTTEAAGAVGGAAVNGVIGGVTGAADGVRRGLKSGSHSTPTAALTLGALGVTGLVEWPVVLTVGGAALLLRQLNQHRNGAAAPTAPTKAASQASTGSGKSAQRRATPAKRAPATRTRARQARP
ncbi:MAG TPA: hypothetical protein VEF72_00670 [Mycobacterium sp.]|nr:hypothetical protein [Mycobacterium sp.]